jgi:hypothetical protein
MAQAARQPITRLASSVAAPLGVIALAYGLWWISDRLLYIGPLDRATFGWAVVIPIWLLAPFVAALAWRSLSSRTTMQAAVLFGAIVTGVSALLFWRAVAFLDCENGAIRTPTEWVVPSLVLGAVIGGGVAISGLVAVRILKGGHPWWALVAGATTSFAMFWVAVAVFATVASGPGCQRPPIV